MLNNNQLASIKAHCGITLEENENIPLFRHIEPNKIHYIGNYRLDLKERV